MTAYKHFPAGRIVAGKAVRSDSVLLPESHMAELHAWRYSRV
jgi:hypothetical protein